MENERLRAAGGKIYCRHGHLVGVKDDERGKLTVRHQGRVIEVLCAPETSIGILCEKCKTGVRIRFGPVEGTRRMKFTQTYLTNEKIPLD